MVRFVTVAPPKSDASLFHLVLIKPTHYDDDGYPIQWVKAAIPSNTLACLNGLAVEARRHEHQLRTLAHGRGRRHRRSNAEGARLVARRGDYAPFGAVAAATGRPRSLASSRCSTDA